MKENKKNKGIIVVLFVLLLIIFNFAYFSYNVGVLYDSNCLLELQNTTYEELDEKYASELETLENNRQSLLDSLDTYKEGSDDYVLLSEKIDKLEDLKYYLAIYNGNHSEEVKSLIKTCVEFDIGVFIGAIIGYVVVSNINKRKEKE